MPFVLGFLPVFLAESNSGNVHLTVSPALIAKLPGIVIVNCIVNIKSKISPSNLLDTLLQIESEFGRERGEKNEARVIDLDLIAYNRLIVNSLKLTLPHPRMHLRKFVIQPICDINKNWIHPVLKKKASEILKELANQKISNINKN